MNSPWQLIDTPASFAAAVAELKTQPELAVDFEGEWNCHHYGVHLCLIQVADRQRCWLIDPLAVGDLAPFLAVLTDETVLKVLHDPQCDFLLLDRLHQCHPRNVFDTARAAQLLGREQLSLEKLLAERCAVPPAGNCQADDWFIRPLPVKMLDYAAHDVVPLLALKDALLADLQAAERLPWAQEEFALLEQIRFTAEPDPHLRLKGSGKLNPREKEVLRALFGERDRLAQKLNKPAYFILGNPHLITLAQHPPRSVADWKKLKGCHPAVPRDADGFYRAVGQGLKAPLPKPVKADGHHVGKDVFRVREKLLLQVQKQVTARYPGIAKLVLSGTTIGKLAAGTKDYAPRRWQREIIVGIARELGLADGLRGWLD